MLEKLSQKIKKILKILIPKLRSKVFWISFISLIILIFDQFEYWNKLGITKDEFSNITKIILGFLISAGIFTNHDKKKENDFEGQEDWT